MYLRKQYLQTAFTELGKSHRYIYVLFDHLPAEYFSIACSFDYHSVKEGDGAKSQPTRSYTLSEFFAALPEIDEFDGFHVKILDRTLTNDKDLTTPNLEQCYRSCLYLLCETSMFDGRLLELTPKLICDYGLNGSDAAIVRDLLWLYNHMAAVKHKVDIPTGRSRWLQDDMAWRRLEQIMVETRHTVNSLSKHIGLLRSENLYQIKRGNNGISRNLASRIHNFYPQYSLSWILTGIDETKKAVEVDSSVIRLPLYGDHTTMHLPPTEPPTEHLTLSASVALDAEFALSYSDEILNPYLLNAILLMKLHRETDEILFGEIYLVQIQGRRLFRILKSATSNPNQVYLTTLRPSNHANVLVEKSRITGLWLAVGAVCKFCR